MHTQIYCTAGRLVYSAKSCWMGEDGAVVGSFTGVTMDLVDGRDGSDWLVDEDASAGRR